MAAVILVTAALLLWPAVLNGYPLLFGDTGVYVVDGIERHVSWPRPMFYGLFMLPLHLRITTWPVVIAQAVVASVVLMSTMRGFAPRLSTSALIPIAMLLSAGTSLPWFVSQLMPDLFGGLMVLVLARLFLARSLHPAWQVVSAAFAAGCITTHLSFMPLALALIASLLAYRLWQRRGIGVAMAAKAVAVPVLATVILIGTNAVLIGQASMSPYGKIFLLNRILVDGPGVRALVRECPQPSWTLCGLKEEIPTITDEDDMLWGENAVLARAGGYRVVAPQVWPIIRSAFRAEPVTLVWQALRNTAIQFISFRSGDALLRPSPFSDGVWHDVFSSEEQARYHAGRQYRGLALIPSWLQTVHLAIGALGLFAIFALIIGKIVHRDAVVGLLVAIAVSLLTNAFVSGGLSGVYDRYQSRLVWLAPVGVLLALTRTWRTLSKVD